MLLMALQVGAAPTPACSLAACWAYSAVDEAGVAIHAASQAHCPALGARCAADSVMIALYGPLLRNPAFDLVVSGINRGDNCGLHVIYSGTVGAAREAACKVGQRRGQAPCSAAPLKVAPVQVARCTAVGCMDGLWTPCRGSLLHTHAWRPRCRRPRPTRLAGRPRHRCVTGQLPGPH